MYLYHRLKNTVQLEGTPGLGGGDRRARRARRAAAPRRRSRSSPTSARSSPPTPTRTTAGAPWARRSRRPRRSSPGSSSGRGSASRTAPRIRRASTAPSRTSTRRAALGRPEALAHSDHEWLFNRGAALLLGHGDLRARAPRRCSCPGLEARAPAAARVRAARRGRARAHRRARLARRPAGPPARHEPLLVGGVRRLGRGAARRPARADVPPRLRHRGRRRVGLRVAPRRAPPLRRRRHDGDDARGARLELLARDARRHDHDRLQRHVPRGRDRDRAG